MWPCVARGHVADQSELSESRPVLTATALLLNPMMGQKHLKKEVNNGWEWVLRVPTTFLVWWFKILLSWDFRS